MEAAIGRVSRADRDRFTVLLDGKEYPAVLKGTLLAGDGERPVVGDYVAFTRPAQPTAGDGRIEALLPRKSVLKRADASGHVGGYVKTMREQVMAANFDFAFLAVSLNQNYNVNRLARYVSLVLEGGGLPVIVLTKADLCADPAPYLAEAAAISPNVRVHAVSARTGQGISELGQYLQSGSTVVLLGSSGVGKSTLVNRLMGREVMKTQAIREKDARGRHTTTARQLLLLENGAVLIDTPGMRELGLIDAEAGVRDAFSDVETLAAACRFRNCSHTKEPGCAVRAALADGTLSPERWALYQELRAESRENAAHGVPFGRKRKTHG